MRTQRRVNGRGGTLLRNGQPRPLHYNPERPRRLINAFASTTGWTQVTGTVTAAAITNPEGLSQTCVRMLGASANANIIARYTLPVAGNLSAYDGVEFDLYVEFSTYAIRGSSGDVMTVTFFDAGFAESATVSFKVTQGWQRIRLHRSDFTVVGSWDTTTYTICQFRTSAGRASLTYDYYLRDFCWMGFSRPKLCIRFDDIGTSVYDTAFPIMKARGLVGSNAVISDAIGSPTFGGYDRCTAAELREMNAAGWDCTNHTKSHQQTTLLTATQADCFTEIDTCRTALLTNGLGNGISENIFCAPYGEFSANYWAAMVQAGTVMSSWSGDDGTNNCSPQSDVIFPLGGFGTLPRCVPGVLVTNTYATSLEAAKIDSWLRKGGFLTFIFHHVVTSPSTSIERSTADFTTTMDYLAARADQFDCVNASQLYEQTRL